MLFRILKIYSKVPLCADAVTIGGHVVGEHHIYYASYLLRMIFITVYLLLVKFIDHYIY